MLSLDRLVMYGRLRQLGLRAPTEVSRMHKIAFLAGITLIVNVVPVAAVGAEPEPVRFASFNATSIGPMPVTCYAQG